MFQNLTNQQKGSLLAFIGVMFITPDTVLIRLSNIETWGLLFYRGAIPFLVVLIGLLLFYKKNFFKALLNIGYPGIFYIFRFENVSRGYTFLLSFIVTIILLVFRNPEFIHPCEGMWILLCTYFPGL